MLLSRRYKLPLRVWTACIRNSGVFFFARCCPHLHALLRMCVTRRCAQQKIEPTPKGRCVIYNPALNDIRCDGTPSCVILLNSARTVTLNRSLGDGDVSTEAVVYAALQFTPGLLQRAVSSERRVLLGCPASDKALMCHFFLMGFSFFFPAFFLLCRAIRCYLFENSCIEEKHVFFFTLFFLLLKMKARRTSIPTPTPTPFQRCDIKVRNNKWVIREKPHC